MAVMLDTLVAGVAHEALAEDASRRLAAGIAATSLAGDDAVELAPLAHAALRRAPEPPTDAAGTVSAVVALVLDAVDEALSAEGLDADVLRAARAAGLDDVAAHARLARALQAGRADSTLEHARQVVAACREASGTGAAAAATRRRVREAALAITAGVDQLDEPAALRALAALAPLAAPSAELAAELLDAARPLGDLSLLETP